MLRAKLRQVSLPARLHWRYRVIALVRAGHTFAEAATRTGLNVNNTSLWVHRFNESGLRDFERPNNPRGRIPILTARQLRELVDTALTSPAKLGLPFTSWSVRTLTEYRKQHHHLPDFSDEWVRRLLRQEGLTAQRIRTWKTSSDPKFSPKDDASAPSASSARHARRWSASMSGARSSSGR